MSDQEATFIEVVCPHCNGTIIVAKHEINCQIFRHATMKKGGQQINPHASKFECDRLVAADAVNGCCKPFRIDLRTLKAQACDYI